MLLLFPGGASSLQSEQLVKNAVSEDTEMAVDDLDASCILKSTTQDTMSKGQSQDETKGQCGSCNAVCGPILYLEIATVWFSVF